MTTPTLRFGIAPCARCFASSESSCLLSSLASVSGTLPDLRLSELTDELLFTVSAPSLTREGFVSSDFERHDFIITLSLTSGDMTSPLSSTASSRSLYGGGGLVTSSTDDSIPTVKTASSSSASTRNSYVVNQNSALELIRTLAKQITVKQPVSYLFLGTPVSMEISLQS